MNKTQQLARRGLCLCCAAASAIAAGLTVTPQQVYAETLGAVPLIQAAVAPTPIAIHHVRGDISVLDWSDGNITVLRGRHGKLMVDSGIAVSRPQVATALAALGLEPLTQKRLLGRDAAERSTMLDYHWPVPGVGHVGCGGTSFLYRPALEMGAER